MNDTHQHPHATASSDHADQGVRRTGLAAVLAGLFRQWNFLIAVAVLTVAAFGLNASVQFLQLHFKKLPVPMAMKFADAMPPVIGHWVRAAKDDTMDSETLAALGTKEFLFCNYINAQALGLSVDQLKRRLESKSFYEQRAIVEELRRERPTDVLTLGLTYYTGSADTVSHIPERCYVGNGFDIVDPSNEIWTLPSPSIKTPERQVAVRHITFEDNVGRSAAAFPHNVAYFFHVNGTMTSDSLDVRRALQDLRARHGYYAKLELMTITPPFRPEQKALQERTLAESKDSMRKFLALALPEFEKAMPDWSKYAR